MFFQGHTITLLCDNPDYPVENGQVSLVAPDPWPVCQKLACHCLGYTLTVEESLRVLRTSCPSAKTVTQYKNVNNVNYVVAKRTNCGTYKPYKGFNPTSENGCICEELGVRKFLMFLSMNSTC
jgi:hypothetical protein